MTGRHAVYLHAEFDVRSMGRTAHENHHMHTHNAHTERMWPSSLTHMQNNLAQIQLPTENLTKAIIRLFVSGDIVNCNNNNRRRKLDEHFYGMFQLRKCF